MAEEAFFLWVGRPLGWLQEASLLSARDAGFRVVLYSDLHTEIDGVELRSHLDILSRDTFDRIRAAKLPIAFYADLFRYKLFQHTDGWWFDADTIVLREEKEFERLRKAYGAVFGRQFNGQITNGVFYASDPGLMQQLFDDASARVDRGAVNWGETGPDLVSRIVADWVGVQVVGEEFFYPLPFRRFHEIWTGWPDELKTDGGPGRYAMTFWNTAAVRSGLHLLAPARESWLGSRCKTLKIRPATDYSQLVELLVSRQEGGNRKTRGCKALGPLKSLLRSRP